MKITRRVLVPLVAIVLAATACSDGVGSGPGAGETPAPSVTGNGLSVAPASFDLAVGEGARFTAGVFTPERELVVGGEVQMQFVYLGEEQAATSGESVATTTGTFLPVPGREPEGDLDQPRLTEEPTATGVYETTVDFDRSGFYGVVVSADVRDLGEVRGTASFQVLPEHQVPTVGEPAPKVSNDLVGSDADPVAIDSRAQNNDGQVPDPQLHDRTVADAIEAGEPTVVVLSTPVYCVSRFCGPITEYVEGLAERFGDRAEFIHIEVWRDFETRELNPAAAEWIQPESGSGGEPWVFLVGPDGNVQARWDNVLDGRELEAALEDLPSS